MSDYTLLHEYYRHGGYCREWVNDCTNISDFYDKEWIDENGIEEWAPTFSKKLIEEYKEWYDDLWKIYIGAYKHVRKYDRYDRWFHRYGRWSKENFNHLNEEIEELINDPAARAEFDKEVYEDLYSLAEDAYNEEYPEDYDPYGWGWDNR